MESKDEDHGHPAAAAAGSPEPNVAITVSKDEDHGHPAAAAEASSKPNVAITIMPSSKDGQAAPSRPVLNKDDATQASVRSGLLRMHFETATVLFGKVRQWKERYVHIDQTDGIFIAPSRESFEKGDRKNVKNLPFSDISGVLLKTPDESLQAKVNECRFVVYVKPRSQPMFGKAIELETPAGLEDAQEWVKYLREKILVKARVYTVGLNGEFPENKRGFRPNVAICFSGGGGRAHVCAASQMRALHYLGLLKKGTIDYISAVSAGAWATSIYTFYEKGASSDDELFGPLVAGDLKQWTMEKLETATLPPILKPALESCMKVASELVWTINSHELWERVMGKIFLKPFGLNKDYPYAMREDVDAIKRENPHLANTKFIVPRENRPFWTCHGTIIGPEWAKIGDMLPIQFSALYTGSPYLHKIHYSDKSNSSHREQEVWVGGGMVDSFAFGGDEPMSTAVANYRPSIVPALTGSSSTSSMRNFFKRSTKSMSPSKSTKAMTHKHSSRGKSSKQTNAMPKLASEAFVDLVVQQTQNAAKAGQETATALKTRAMPLYSNDVADAVNTLNLAPQMVQRVFRHAQEALRSQGFYTAKALKDEGGGANDIVDEGVLERAVQIPYPTTPFCLRHTLGISSDAPSVNLHEKATFKRLNVQERYWTPVFVETTHNDEKSAAEPKASTPVSLGSEFNMAQNIATTHAITMDMGDGGSLDNLGVLGMLQRGVRKLIVFVNTNNLIPPPQNIRKEFRSSKVEYDANRRMSVTRMSLTGLVPSVPIEREGSSGDNAAPPTPTRRSVRLSMDKTVFAEILKDETPPTFDEWADDDILPLFGQSVDEKMLNYLGTHHSHNHVFPLKELRPLLRQMQNCMIKGEAVVVRAQHEVLENPFWGIQGGWKVDVVWVYLDDISNFRSMLPDDTMQELDRNKGEFARFPNFKTFGNNATFSFDISLTPRQVNLLSAFTEYQVMSKKDLFESFVKEELPPLDRKRKKVENALTELEKEGFA